MRNVVIVITLVVILGLGAFVYITRPCFGAICSIDPCSDNMDCGRGCVCIKDPEERLGECYSTD